MKVCFFGVGSIGKRHINNLRSICNRQNIDLHIAAFRTGNSKYEREISGLVDDQIIDANKLDNDYDLIFICNPTSMHYQTLKSCVQKDAYYFIEKPVFDKIYNDYGIFSELKSYVAAPLRFSEVIRYLKKMLPGEKVLSARIICSTYLPDWRKGVDYRKTYSAEKELGGGVSIDLIHESDYMKYLFGMPESFYSAKGKFSALEINSDDLATFIYEYKDKIVEMHLDYFGVRPKREIEIFCDGKVIIGDVLNNRITVCGINESCEEINFAGTDFYVNEMEYFLQTAMLNKKSINPVSDAVDTLKLVLEN